MIISASQMIKSGSEAMMFESDMITSAPQITVSGTEMITSGLEAINSGPKTIDLLTEKIIVTREPTTSVSDTGCS